MSKREQKRIRALERRVSVLETAVLLKYMEANFTETKAAVESRIKESFLMTHKHGGACTSRRP